MTNAGTLKRLVLAPAGALVLSLAAAALFALWVNDRLAGERRVFWLYYFVPIAVPFVAFALDRVGRWRASTWAQWAIDLPVVAAALARAFWPVPLISGHVLFLAYALLTTRSAVARVTAILVLVEVFYLKFMVWRDFVTWTGGWLVAGAAAWMFRRVGKRSSPGEGKRHG